MTPRASVRPGGRSARVQAAVHKAVKDLSARIERDDLTIPQIAEQAGVTPSTLYRRWGNLTELLADVAVESMRPDTPPADTGSLRGDLTAWAEQYLEEMSSRPGRAMMREVIATASDYNAVRCCTYVMEQFDVMIDRAKNRGDNPPAADLMIDLIVAPIIFRLIFDDRPLEPQFCTTLVNRLLGPLGV